METTAIHLCKTKGKLVSPIGDRGFFVPKEKSMKQDAYPAEFIPCSVVRLKDFQGIFHKDEIHLSTLYTVIGTCCVLYSHALFLHLRMKNWLQLKLKRMSLQNCNTSSDENFLHGWKDVTKNLLKLPKESCNSDSLGFLLSHHQQETQEAEILNLEAKCYFTYNAWRDLPISKLCLLRLIMK